MPLACLDEGRVLQFLAGTLHAAVRAEVEVHLGACPKCSDLVTWAAADLAASGPAPEPTAPEGHVSPGSQIGRYQVLGAIGRGAMGQVFAAYHPDLDRRIALKLVTRAGGEGAPEHRLRLLREARAIARVSHPNVVAVHDAGTFGGSVYIAMEFVDGETVADWLRTPRSWRQILQVFLAAGRGLVAAHAAGVVHRDFKPQNVMIAKTGSVRVMDFGLALFARDGGAEGVVPGGAHGELGAGATTVTKAGVIVGTPAYMAPEQFNGERGDARSDQFSFCVALYEALYGERPFSGDDALDLSVNVTEGRVRPLPRDRGVPAWLRRAVMAGLKRDPSSRWPSMSALIAALESPPAARLRRRLLALGAIAAGAAVLLTARQLVTTRRAEGEREIGRHVERGRSAVSTAREKEAAARALRGRAFAAFDALHKDEGESLWRRTRALIPEVEASFEEAARAFEAAATLAPDRAEIRATLADVRYQHLLFGEDFRLSNRSEVLGERLAAADFDGSRRRALAVPGWLSLRTEPVAARAVLERYERDPATGRRDPRPMGPIDASRSRRELPPGSYRLLLEGPGLAQVAYPFEITRGHVTAIDLAVPAAAAVPRGFVYVPAGESWYGDADETLRTGFLRTAPLHRRATGAFLIARRETTYAEWIAFLEAMSPKARGPYLPDVAGATRGGLRLREAGARGWQLAFQPATARYTAFSGESIRYLGRKQRAAQSWLAFPVAGVDAAGAEAFAGWLRSTGAVPGARLCTDVEWERAARGGDDRLFPHGDELEPADANFGSTHDMADAAYGPDEVGSHPASRSPFGVDDLAGNVFEIVVSSEEPDRLVLRGGAYYFDALTCRANNRETIPKGFRDATAGIRVCASLEGGPPMTQSGH